MSREELSQEIQIHDFHHAMSDDNRVWRQGANHYQLIQDELKKCSSRLVIDVYSGTSTHRCLVTTEKIILTN